MIIKIKNLIINAIEAKDDLTKRIGLQFVNHLGKNSGMIFCYDSIQPKVIFHTKNVCFPLDIIGIDSFNKITLIQQVLPEENNINFKNVQYVLEVSKDLMKNNGIKEGAKVEFNSIIDNILKEARWLQPKPLLQPLIERRDYAPEGHDILEQNAQDLKSEGKLPKDVESEFKNRLNN